MYAHKDADRIPIIDGPWGTTIERWHREGMPTDIGYVEYFGLDKTVGIGADNGPRWPRQIIEETEEYIIEKTPWGVTYRNWKHIASTPEYLDFTVRDRDTWREAKERMTPDPDRIPWDWIKRDYKSWREAGCWINYGFWFGFDITHAHMVGTENILMMLAEDPEWCAEMFNHELDVDIALFEQIWDAAITPTRSSGRTHGMATLLQPSQLLLLTMQRTTTMIRLQSSSISTAGTTVVLVTV